ncbi:MAG: type VII toxin-antitoxin system MntA family adenylyltransferase antitoxin [Desulfomonilaceae bacterium]
MIDSVKKKIPELGALKGVFQKYPEIQAVYLFGSFAIGKMKAGSDLDLGIVTRSPSLRERKLDILADLAMLGFCDVDLVFLDVEDIVLRSEIVKHNKVIYQRGDFDKGEYYSRILRQYFDFLPYLKVQREALKRRILDGKH